MVIDILSIVGDHEHHCRFLATTVGQRYLVESPENLVDVKKTDHSFLAIFERSGLAVFKHSIAEFEQGSVVGFRLAFDPPAIL